MFARRLPLLVIGSILVLLFAGVLLSLPAAAQSPVPVPSGGSGTMPDNSSGSPLPPGPPNSILYSQYDHAGLNSYTSQNFEPLMDQYDSFIADDFVVPAGQLWEVNEVDVQGEYFSGVGPADSFNVLLYTEAITLPQTLIVSRLDMGYTNVMTNFNITVSPAISLKPGKYWVSVQANQNFDTNGQWGWRGRTATKNYPAAFQNPGGGFNPYCTSWGDRVACIGGPEAPDQVFRLVGTSVFPTCGVPSKWVFSNDLPYSAYGPSVTNDGKNMYVFGGFDITGSKEITQTVRYDPVIGTWTQLKPVPHPVTMGSSFYSPTNNKIYLFGGQDTTLNIIYDTTLIYDIASNTWSTGASMPDKRNFMAGGYHNGKIYLVGGYSTQMIDPVYAQTWEYNVQANTWTTKADMPSASGGAASAVISGHLYVIGGRYLDHDALTHTYDYNIAANTWSVRSDAPYGVNVPGSAAVNGKVWVIGGGTPFLGTEVMSPSAITNAPNTMNSTLFYDPTTDTWSAGPSLNVLRSFVGSTYLKGRLFAVGGFNTVSLYNVVEEMGICSNYLVQLRGKAPAAR